MPRSHDVNHVISNSCASDIGNGIVKLNVGGKKFLTRYGTLAQNGSQENFFVSLLSGRFPVESDEKGYIFIDRSAKYFEVILDFLRSGELNCPKSLSMKRIIQEANYYGVNIGDAYLSTTSKEDTAPLTDESLKELLISYKTSSLERNYKENREGLKLVEQAVFKGFRSEAAKGKQVVVRFWPATNTIINRCKQKWGDIIFQPLPPFMVNDPAHVFDNSLYEVCKKGKQGLCWHLSKKHLSVEATDNSDYLTTHTHVDRNNATSINTYAWWCCCYKYNTSCISCCRSCFNYLVSCRSRSCKYATTKPSFNQSKI